MATRVLIIEDDLNLCKLFQFTLSKVGYEVEFAHTAKTGLQRAYASNPDLIILDIMLPDMNGFEACARFREMSNVPIVMLTSLGSEENVIKGLKLGADDYIVKPVTTEELLARIRAVLRRSGRANSDSYAGNQEATFTHEQLAVNFKRREVTIEGKKVSLSPTEFDLLSLFIQNRGHLLSHEFLLRNVWGEEYLGEVDYLWYYVSSLRRKLDKPAKSNLIHNVWGMGYRFG